MTAKKEDTRAKGFLEKASQVGSRCLPACFWLCSERKKTNRNFVRVLLNQGIVWRAVLESAGGNQDRGRDSV